jgi:chromate transporter
VDAEIDPRGGSTSSKQPLAQQPGPGSREQQPGPGSREQKPGPRSRKDDEPPPASGGAGPLTAFVLAAPNEMRRRFETLVGWLGLSGIAVPVTLAIFFTFARVGAVAYGGGFTIVPLLEREAVEQHAWITHREFADAIALGQVTPGPVIIAATFIGTRAGGVAGGILATLGVFGVPALLVIGAGAWLDRWRRARPVKAALRGLVPAVVGMMTAAAFGLANAGIHGEVGVLLAVIAFVAVTQYRLNPAMVVLGSGGLRVALQVIGNV